MVDHKKGTRAAVKPVVEPAKTAGRAAAPVKKEEPKAAAPAAAAKEEPKAAAPAKKEEPKAAAPAKKEEPKAAAPAAAKEEPKAVAPAKKETAKPAAKKAVKEPKAEVHVQFDGKDIVAREVLDEALKSYKKSHRGVEIKDIQVYIVANENAAYYVVNGEASDDFRIEL